MDTNTQLEEALNGNTEAFARLVEAHQQRLYAFSLKMTHSKEDAEEIVQETLIRAFKNLWRFDGRASFSTWLYTIANNLCKSIMKRKKRVTVSLDELVSPEEEPLWHQAQEPSELLMLSETRREARRLMAFLKPDQKSALILKYMEGLTYEDIGRILKITEEAAKMKVYRAKKEILKRYPYRGGAL